MKYSLLVYLMSTGIALLSGCSSIEVRENQRLKFNSNETITVICRGQDSLGLRGELEHLLISQGFDVVSEEVAKKKAKTDLDVDLNEKKLKVESRSTMCMNCNRYMP